jgi:hypothetical protein
MGLGPVAWGLGTGDWGLGTGDWGLGTGDWGQKFTRMECEVFCWKWGVQFYGDSGPSPGW